MERSSKKGKEKIQEQDVCIEATEVKTKERDKEGETSFFFEKKSMMKGEEREKGKEKRAGREREAC